LSERTVTASLTVGLVIGGTKVLGVALSDDGEVVAECRRPTPRDEASLIDAAAGAAEELVASTAGRGEVAAVGVGAPGLVDRDGVLRVAPNLPFVDRLPLRASLASRLHVPVRADNDATCAAWGERELGAARGTDHVVLITLGTGIGGGIIAGGRLYRGANGFAGEVGHMVVEPHGPPCPCGQRGCWERYASGSGLGRLAREAAHAGQAPAVLALAGGDPEGVRGEHVTRAAIEGDPGACAVFVRFAWWLALGLANLANVFDPELFVIGGGLVEAGDGDVLFEPARKAFAGLVEAAARRPDIAIVPAALGERAGALGAAALARTVGK
jgi:glucokinase